MKAIHKKNGKKDLPLVEWLNEARQLEEEDKSLAVKEYKQIALAYPTNEKAFNRLMILFRQLKSPKDEIYWIDKAIGNFQKRFKKPGIRPNSKIASLSKSISHSTGLSDKKGNALYQPAPTDRWHKRKEILIKRMKKPGSKA
jgi:hypothetical protein